jgi:hypothetical protein
MEGPRRPAPMNVVRIHHVAFAHPGASPVLERLTRLGLQSEHAEAADGFIERMLGAGDGFVQLLEPTGGMLLELVERAPEPESVSR